LFWTAGYKLNIGHDNIIKERAIICICYKWAGEKEVHSLTWDNKQNDKSLLEKLQKRPDGLTVLTPHPGEAARLLNMTTEEVQIDRLGALAKLVDLSQSIVVLKGQGTLIGAPKQTSKLCLRGNSGMGVGGMGDVLTGILAAVIAQGLHHDLLVFESTCLAVDIHSEAADTLVDQGVGPIGLTPSEVIHQVRRLINFK
jgi:NAD(P)H-hydrate repair Nnr-like enzyme with NAD(P)H-hydrate dehydratase domain